MAPWTPQRIAGLIRQQQARIARVPGSMRRSTRARHRAWGWQLRRAADIKNKIESLQKELDRLLGGEIQNSATPLWKRRRMSATGRARIAAAGLPARPHCWQATLLHQIPMRFSKEAGMRNPVEETAAEARRHSVTRLVSNGSERNISCPRWEHLTVPPAIPIQVWAIGTSETWMDSLSQRFGR
jgi:hypothetical protein